MGSKTKKLLKTHPSACSNDPSRERVLDKRRQALCEVRMAEQSVNLAGRKCVAIDCEMVGTGERGRRSELARCSIVDVNGKCIMDEYVLPQHPITDYRTRFSGIRPRHMKKAVRFKSVQRRVTRILRDSLLVGHALRNDLGVLALKHPKESVRDTERCKQLRLVPDLDEAVTPSLRRLARHHLQRIIQDGEHDSVVDARATMELYRMFEEHWELDIKLKNSDWMDDQFWPESMSNCNSRCPSDDESK
ncbi:apoptosis-enhancing nuclease-like [Sycon ciliatum]|uniref:apoptosis-enhancing nuclease-like n=1 Tax=Sycon ciliatum TaxID=27933 RepID=UPI0020AC89A5|eukprot:scpid91385/ scgid27244/ Apoptosis-enhancing nuclease; Interferon-stimulated 20 kDa exonuclease-like 1